MPRTPRGGKVGRPRRTVRPVYLRTEVHPLLSAWIAEVARVLEASTSEAARRLLACSWRDVLGQVSTWPPVRAELERVLPAADGGESDRVGS